jgi:hypothetical protein
MTKKESEASFSENTKLSTNAAFAGKLILAVASGVWLWGELTNRMSSMEMQMGRVQHESTQLGDLSARVMHIEKFTEQAKADLDHLVEMQDSPITSDHQQFERLKYLEKELDRLRDKVEGINR